MRIVMALVLGLALAAGVASQAGCEDCNLPANCCKVCKDSKPCGDSCIARSQTCNVGGGCACSGATSE
jgi:hypothetical protein